MKYISLTNPFPATGYNGPTYFCDREAESQKINQLLQNGQSCLLMGNRRLGKTALIQHVRQMLPKHWEFIYLIKEIIFKEYREKGEPFYEVCDVFFERWIQSLN